MKRHFFYLVSIAVILASPLFGNASSAKPKTGLPLPAYSQYYTPQQKNIIDTKGLPEAFILQYDINPKTWTWDRFEIWKYYTTSTMIKFLNGKQIEQLYLAPEGPVGKALGATTYKPQQLYQSLSIAQIARFSGASKKTELRSSPKRTITTWRNNLVTSHNAAALVYATAQRIEGAASKTPVPAVSQNKPAIVLNPASSEVVARPLANGKLPLHWTFDNISGNSVIDTSNPDNIGSIVSATQATGHTGQALSFNGNDSAVNTTIKMDQTAASTGLTVDMWVYPLAADHEDTVFSTDNGGFDWTIVRAKDNRWVVFTGDDRVDTGFSADLNAWQHLVAVFNPATHSVHFFKNNEYREIKQLGFDSSINFMTIGRNPTFGASFRGLIDEVEVSGRVIMPEAGVVVVPPTRRRTDDIVVGPNDPTLQWSFENIQGMNVIDDSNAGTLGTLSSATAVTGHSGNGVNLDGKTSFVGTTYKPNQATTSRGLTMSVWVKPANTQGGTLLSTDNGGWDWSIYSDGKTWFVGTGDAGVDTGLSLNVGAWQHLTAIFDPVSKSIRFYKDGTLKILPGLGFDSSTDTFTVGRNPSFGGTNFAGVVDDVVVYPFARSGE